MDILTKSQLMCGLWYLGPQHSATVHVLGRHSAVQAILGEGETVHVLGRHSSVQAILGEGESVHVLSRHYAVQAILGEGETVHVLGRHSSVQAIQGERETVHVLGKHSHSAVHQIMLVIIGQYFFFLLRNIRKQISFRK